MKRSSSSDYGSEGNRSESFPSSSNRNQQQKLSSQQQSQIQVQQQLQQQQYEAQQQQFQMHQQFQEFQQQQQQQQQIQEFQQQQQMQEFQQQQQMQEFQQQQFAANQQFYNSAAYYNYSQYVPSQSPLLYNSVNPSWNFMATPPPFYGSSPSSSTPQPPLPPPDLKPEKPPLPKEPEPGNENQTETKPSMVAGPSGINGQKQKGGIRVRGLNGINSGGINGMNNGIRQNGTTGGKTGRGRRRNPHFSSPMQPPSTPSAQDLAGPGESNEISQLLDEDLPAGSDKVTIFLNNTEHMKIHVNKKSKRKPMSTRYTRSKLWLREEAVAALALEKEFNRVQKRTMLILKFPDPDLNKYMVKKYSPFIETVHFQQPSTPRYCFVQLKEDADVDKVVNTLRQIPFGTGKISAEVKSHHLDDQGVTPEEIDPYTLYIGNLPTHISVRVVKQYFPNAQRIDIGYAQRMRYTRYAFIRYNSVAESFEAYRKTVNALLDSRSLIVRFRRQKGNIGLPGEPKSKVQKRGDREDSPSKEQNALIIDADLHDDVNEEDDTVTEYDEDTTRVEKDIKKVLKSAENLEAISPKADDVTAGSTMGTARERKPSNATGLNGDAKDATNPGTKPVRTAPEETSTTLYSPESLGDELDTKEKVLNEARELMRGHKGRRALSPINFSAFTEPTELTKGPVEGDIKLEHSEDEDSSDDGGINLLGTRIKDEPFETPHRAPIDELYYDDYDYDDLCTDVDEDEDSWSNNSDSRSRQLLTTNWELVRRSELNAREDKPDLNELRAPEAESMQPPAEVPAIKVNLEPKKEVSGDLNEPGPVKPKRDQVAVKQELEDMFNRLNSDAECDDEDAFFGAP